MCEDSRADGIWFVDFEFIDKTWHESDGRCDAVDVVGVVNNATAPIKAAGVGVFVVSTWCVQLSFL